MGSKGSQTSNTSQSQTYAPAGAGYIQNALQQGQNAAQLPFNIPQAPVAGFSPQQQQAFQEVGAAQGQAQPYINQANQYFQQSAQAPNISQFFNPYAGAVTSQLNNIFGQQASQNTGQLTQAAGGVGADRIAVGQSQLANQQGLSAGQTLAGLYAPSLTAAQQEQNIQQGAGYGTGFLGSQAQNASLTGAQALLGSGGLQQQLSQAQLNSPYQQALAQAAFPYQQAQFNAGITGALAPALGGTTAGQSQSQSQYNPSPFSQILGGLGGLGSIAGYFGGSGGKGAQPQTGATFGGYGGGNTSGYGSMGGISYPAFASGGTANPFAFDGGGMVDPSQMFMSAMFRDRMLGGENAPETGAQSIPSGQPMESGAPSIIPQANLPQAQAHIPQLNLNPPQQSGGGGSGGGTDIGQAIGSIAKIIPFLKRGGSANPYAFADGGESTDPDTTPALFGDRFPSYASAGPDNAPVSALGGTGMTPEDRFAYPVGRADAPFNPMRMADPEAVQAWRDSTPATPDGGADASTPPGAAPTRGMQQTGAAPETASAPSGGPAPSAGPAQAAPGAMPQAAEERGPSLGGFLKSPYAALLQASLSAFTPQGFAGGLAQGMKEYQGQQTIDQSAKRLAQEAKFHEDQFTRMTPHEKFEESLPRPYGQTIGPLGLPMTTYALPDGKGGWKPVQGGPAGETGPQDNPIQNIAKAIESGHQPPTLTGMYRMAPMVKSQLEKDGFNLSQANLEWDAAHKQVLSLNGPQMVRFVGLANSVDNTITEANNLAAEMKNSGIPLLNQIKLQGLINTEGNSPRGQLAARYLTTINTLKEEFASLAQGGYAPHESAWELANQQINGNYGVQELGASLGEVQRLIRYRMQGIPNIQTLGPGSANKYVPGIAGQPGGANSAAQGATPAGGAQPPAAPTTTRVKQGNHTYERQPDGSYKAID